MKALTFTSLVWIVLATTGFGRIGDDEKQIEAHYGKAGKDMGTHGDIHQIGYVANGFMILVDYVKGISQREGFANPDSSPLTNEAIEQILKMSAVEGTKWKPVEGATTDRSWRRTDEKAIAICPSAGLFLFVQDVHYTPPPK